MPLQPSLNRWFTPSVHSGLAKVRAATVEYDALKAHVLRSTHSVDAETRAHLRGAQLSFAVQVTGVAVSYGLQITLARSLGARQFGSYNLVLAWTSPLAMLAGLGLPTVALRFLPVYRHAGARARLAGLVRASERIALAASAGVAVAGSAVAMLVMRHPAPLLVSLWTLPLVGCGTSGSTG